MKKLVILFLFLLTSLAATNRLFAQDDGPVIYNDQSAEEFLASVKSGGRAEEVKIALIGDTESGSNFGAVLKMIAAEKADAVMVNGDFGYAASPNTWKSRVTSSVDINTLPVIGSLGNHDLGLNTNKYVTIFNDFRTDKNGLKTKCTGVPGVAQGHDITAVDEVCTFGNVSVVGSAIGQVLSKTYLENRLEAKLKAAPVDNWKLVGYHFTLSSMNPGIKGNEASFKFFDLIRQYGAIGAQAHTHLAMASCPIISPFKSGGAIQCHPDFKNPEARFIAPGVSVYVDSSLGGKEARSRGRCKNPTDSGCKHMVDLITKEGYTRTDGTKKTNFNRFGALFFVFNIGGDSSKALAYFKSIDGQTIFKFAVVR